jgi:hypothetical protein
MRNLHALATKGQRANGGSALRYLSPSEALHVLSPDAHMPQASTGDTSNSRSEAPVAQQETTLVLTIRHSKPLPELFKDKTAAYCYDWLMARNVPVDVDAKVWYSLTVKEQA